MFSVFRDYGFDLFYILAYLCSVIVVVFISLPVHEYAHAVTAVKLGDPTPKYTGRTTLNPLAHIDYIGALLILFFSFGWAKPVQVNSRYFKNPKRDMAITALAGPVSNVVLGFVFFVFYKLLGYAPQTLVIAFIASFCDLVVTINITLAVFNLIPIPPLDGSRLLSAFLSDRAYYRLMQYERYFSLAVILLLFTNVLDYPILFLDYIIRLFYQLLTFWF